MTPAPQPDASIAAIVFSARKATDLTQDEYGAQYDISGPAVFKFEKGYVRPGLDLWLRLALDAGLSERRAVVLWLMCKLPEEYRQYLEVPPVKSKQRRGVLDYSTVERREDMKAAAAKDAKLPKALRDMLADGELWALFKPTGHEINLLRDMFGGLGKGTKSGYGDALRLIREFTHSF